MLGKLRAVKLALGGEVGGVFGGVFGGVLGRVFGSGFGGVFGAPLCFFAVLFVLCVNDRFCGIISLDRQQNIRK